MIKRLLSFFVLLLFQSVTVLTFAVKAYPYPMLVTQPDGTQLTICLHGDEFQHLRTTEDGYVIKKNTKGFYTYAKKDSKGNFVVSNTIARNLNRRSFADRTFLKTITKSPSLQTVLSSSGTIVRSNIFSSSSTSVPQKSFPLSGTQKSLVILVNFSDLSFVTPDPKTAFTNLLNQDGYSANGGTGSARDYFMSNSYGKFIPDFVVEGPFTLPHPMAYYGVNDVAGNDSLADQMVVDACAAANSTVDFTQYDTDYNGRIDNVFIYYAGYNEAEYGSENSIWPHRGFVIQSSSIPNVKFDGKRVYDYACTSELKGNSGSNMCGIGTFTHEFGHVLGLADYYHTSESSKATLNFWSIMDAGSYSNAGRTPPLYSAYDRFYLGWLTPQEISSGTDVTLEPLYQGKTEPASTAHQSYLLSATTHNLNGKTPDPSEFFILEYRKKTGWDTYLPAEGMCIWHIDYNQTAWSYNEPNNYTGITQTLDSHMRVYLESPTVLPEPKTPPLAAFTTGAFAPTTWAGVNISRPITDISTVAGNITLKIMGGTPFPTIKAGVIDASLKFPATRLGRVNTKLINIKTNFLVGDLSLVLTGVDAALFNVSAGAITKDNANATSGYNISITFNPTTIGNHNATLTISGGGLTPSKVIELSGEGI